MNRSAVATSGKLDARPPGNRLARAAVGPIATSESVAWVSKAELQVGIPLRVRIAEVHIPAGLPVEPDGVCSVVVEVTHDDRVVIKNFAKCRNGALGQNGAVGTGGEEFCAVCLCSAERPKENPWQDKACPNAS